MGRRGFVVGGMVLAMAWATARAQGGPPGQFASELHRSGGYVLQVDGRADEGARFFEGEPPMQVVVLSGNGAGFVLDRPTQSVRRLMKNLALESAAGSMTLLPGAAGEPLAGGYQTDGAGVRFSDSAHGYFVLPKPPLIGDVTAEKILAHSPEYRLAMDQYAPSQAALEQIRRCSPAARIEVFYGSWCPFCRRHVPRLLRALELAKGSPLSVRLVALPKGFSQEKVATERGVQRVPTLIVYDGMREVGRLQGSDWERPEEALVRLLPASRPPAPGSN